MNEIFQPAKFELDQTTGSAKINICSMRYQKACFSENISDFIPPYQSSENLVETEITNVNYRMCCKNWSTKFLISSSILRKDYLKFGNARKLFCPETAPKIKVLQNIQSQIYCTYSSPKTCQLLEEPYMNVQRVLKV